MAATAGYNTEVKVSTDDTSASYNDVFGAHDVSIGLNANMLDVTDFGDTAMSRIAGLLDFPISFSYFYDNSDTAQGALQSALLNGTTVYIQVIPDGTNGFQVECLVESLDHSTSVDGVPTVSASLQSVAAATTSLTS